MRLEFGASLAEVGPPRNRIGQQIVNVSRKYLCLLALLGHGCDALKPSEACFLGGHGGIVGHNGQTLV